MILACPHCSAVYELPRHLLGPGGAAVRCPHCAGEFTLGADGEIAAGVGAAHAAETTAVSRSLAARAAARHDPGAGGTPAVTHAAEAASDSGAGRTPAVARAAQAESESSRTPPAPRAAEAEAEPVAGRAAAAARAPEPDPGAARPAAARAPVTPGPETARATVSMRAPEAALGSAAARAAAGETGDQAEAGSDAQAIARRVLDELAGRKGPAMADANARGKLLSEFGAELAVAFEQFRKESGGTGNPAPFREALRERWGIDLTPPARG